MRIFLLFSMVWVLSGCGKTVLPLPSMEDVPETVMIENSEKQSLGVGVFVADDIFVTPDHLLQNGDLFVNDVLIEIVARDFDHDVLFFRISEDFLIEREENMFSDSPPVIGKLYYRLGGGGFQTVVVENVGGDFALGGESKKKNLIVFEGIIQPGESGTPVFDINGNIQSMLIAADIPKGFSYGVRSDVLLQLYKGQVLD